MIKLAALLAAISFILIFLNGCLDSTYIGNTENWTDDRVNAYYAKCGDIFQLQINLENDGYQWQSDGTNFNYLTDTIATPAFFLSHGGGNCSDWQNMFYQYYLKGNSGIQKYTRWVIRQGYSWHYFSTFYIGNEIYMQSNGTMTQADSIETIKNYWYAKGWEYFDTF